MSESSNTFDRRRFIGHTGKAAAALAVAQPFHVKGEETPKKLRVGIVGCGGRAKSVGAVALKDGRYEIASLADYFSGQADALGEEFGVPAGRRFAGLDAFKRMIDAGGIDVVAVLSPPYFHPGQVEAAVEAELHVYLAKPIAVDSPGVARVEAAAAKAARKRRCFFVDFQTRAFAHFHEAARRVAAGGLGPVGYGEIEGTSGAHALKVPHTENRETRLRNWLQWRDLSGESILEFSIHSIDMASLFMGRKPVAATGECARAILDGMSDPRPGDVRDVWLASYDYGDGCKVLFRGKRFDTHGLSRGITADLFGAKGALHSDYSGEVWIKGENSFSGDHFMKEKIRGIYTRGIANNLDTFYKDVTTGNVAQKTVAPSVESHYLALLAREACYRQGDRVTWDDVVNSTETSEFDESGLKS